MVVGRRGDAETRSSRRRLVGSDDARGWARIRLTNLRAFERFELALGERLTILVGRKPRMVPAHAPPIG